MTRHRRAARALAGSALAAAVVGAAPASARAQAGTFYMGTYADKILVIDEATLQVRDSIPLSIGIPTSWSLSADRSRLYVRNPRGDRVEIVDLATRKTTGTFTLNSPGTTVQIWGMNVDPKERFAILLVKTYAKRLDRYEVTGPKLLKYDLATRTVTDTIAWPRGEEREFAQILFSPAGDLMYFFTTDDVLIYDAVTLKQVDRWDLASSFYEDGMGRINAGFGFDMYEEPGFFTNLFRVNDPVNRRTLMGVGRVDLANRTVDYYVLGPSAPVGGFRLAPGRARAYSIQNEVGNYHFWTFDLANRRVVGKTQFDGRPRMGLTIGTTGERLYIHTAGNSIDVFDVNTFQRLRTVVYDHDMTVITLIPAGAPSARP